MLTSSSIEPEVNGSGWYRVVTRELFHTKIVYFGRLNAHKRVPFYLGTCMIATAFEQWIQLCIPHQNHPLKKVSLRRPSHTLSPCHW